MADGCLFPGFTLSACFWGTFRLALATFSVVGAFCRNALGCAQATVAAISATIIIIVVFFIAVYIIYNNRCS
jgi:hypothetical protein